MGLRAVCDSSTSDGPEIHLGAGDALFYNSRGPRRWHTFPDVGARIILVSVDGSFEE